MLPITPIVQKQDGFRIKIKISIYNQVILICCIHLNKDLSSYAIEIYFQRRDEICLVEVERIELSPLVPKTRVLPLNYTSIFNSLNIFQKKELMVLRRGFEPAYLSLIRQVHIPYVLAQLKTRRLFNYNKYFLSEKNRIILLDCCLSSFYQVIKILLNYYFNIFIAFLIQCLHHCFKSRQINSIKD